MKDKINTLDELKRNEFDCIEPSVDDKFFYGRNEIVVLKTVADNRRFCDKNTNCYFRDKDECPVFACSTMERDDGLNVKFVNVTKRFDIKKLKKIIMSLKVGSK